MPNAVMSNVFCVVQYETPCFTKAVVNKQTKHHPVNHLVKTRMKSHEKKIPLFLTMKSNNHKRITIAKYVNPLKCSW